MNAVQLKSSKAVTRPPALSISNVSMSYFGISMVFVPLPLNVIVPDPFAQLLTPVLASPASRKLPVISISGL